MTGFPWGAWCDATTGGPVWPLLLAAAFQAGYYLLGVARLLAGYGPWPCDAEPPELEWPGAGELPAAFGE